MDQDTTKGRSTQDHPSGPVNSVPQGPAPTAPTSQTGGPPQAPPVNNPEHRSTRIHQNAMEPPVRFIPEHLWIGNRSTGAAKGRNKASEPCPGTSSVQALLHSLLIHLRTPFYVQHVVTKWPLEQEVVLIIISVTSVGVPLTLHTVCHKDQPLQHLHHKLEDHHRLPQSTIRTQITRIHQNAMEPPVDSTRAPVDSKGPGAAKGRNKACQNLTLELHQVQALLHSLLIHLRTPFYVQHVVKGGHWSRNCPYYNFCDFCRVTTHSTHMCRAAKCGPGSPVCIYCGKTNHSSAYCRYRPRDN